MRISIAEAEGQLTELVKLANQGEEVVLTQDGRPSVRLEPVENPVNQASETETLIAELRKPISLASQRKPLTPAEKARRIDEIRKAAPPWDGTEAAHNHNFLYDEHGLPK